MNLKEIRSKVRQLTNEPSAEKVTDGIVNDFINEAQMIIVDEGDLLESFVTLSGDTNSSYQRYDLNGEIWKAEGLGDATSIRLMKVKRVDLGDYKIERIGMHEISDVDTTTYSASNNFFTSDSQLFLVKA